MLLYLLKLERKSLLTLQFQVRVLIDSKFLKFVNGILRFRINATIQYVKNLHSQSVEKFQIIQGIISTTGPLYVPKLAMLQILCKFSDALKAHFDNNFAIFANFQFF